MYPHSVQVNESRERHCDFCNKPTGTIHTVEIRSAHGEKICTFNRCISCFERIIWKVIALLDTNVVQAIVGICTTALFVGQASQ